MDASPGTHPGTRARDRRPQGPRHVSTADRHHGSDLGRAHRTAGRRDRRPQRHRAERSRTTRYGQGRWHRYPALRVHDHVRHGAGRGRGVPTRSEKNSRSRTNTACPRTTPAPWPPSSAWRWKDCWPARRRERQCRSRPANARRASRAAPDPHLPSGWQRRDRRLANRPSRARVSGHHSRECGSERLRGE